MRRSLVSLAVVTALWDQRKKDYIDTFVPFIATLLETRSIQRFEQDNIHALCEQFEEEFGLPLPYFPMLSVLNRCVRRNLLDRSYHGFTVSSTIATDLSFFQERDSYMRKEQALIGGFQKYAQTTFQETIDAVTAEMAMLDFLRRFDIEILMSNDGLGSALPTRPKGRRNRRIVYMFSRFVIDAYMAKPANFRTLCDMALGNMIAAAVLHDGYDYRSDTVRHVNIYIDTPIILRIIGTSGKEQAAVFVQLISELRERGAKLWVFGHSRTEARQILEGARFWVGRIDFDPILASRTALYFRQQGFSDSRIEMFILRLDDVLREHGIEVYSDHPYIENREHQIDETRLKEAIEKYYVDSDAGFDKDKYRDRTLKDVASLAAVARLRAGREPVLMKDAEHVFLSNNSALTRASREVLGSGGGSRIMVPVCVTDVFLGTILWTDAPKKARDAYQKRLVAECYAAIAPDAALESRIVREARRLRDEGQIGGDDYKLLTMSSVTRELLSEKTLGDPEAVNSDTTFEVLEGIKNSIRGETRGKLREVELEKEESEEARKRAELERDAVAEGMAAAAADYGRRWATIVNATIAVGIGATLVLSVTGGIFIHPMAWAISVVAVLVIGWLSFVRGFTMPKNFCRLRAKYVEKYLSKYRQEAESIA